MFITFCNMGENLLRNIIRFALARFPALTSIERRGCDDRIHTIFIRNLIFFYLSFISVEAFLQLYYFRIFSKGCLKFFCCCTVYIEVNVPSLRFLKGII